MEKTEKWFLKRDTKNPNQMVYVSTKGEVIWDIPVDSLPTVEEKKHWDRHPKFVSLQRARGLTVWNRSQHYQENIRFEKEGTLFSPLEYRDDFKLFFSRKMRTSI